MACVESLDELEPCGAGCPRPILCMRGLQVTELTEVGGGKHLRLRLNTSGGGEFAIQANTNGDNWCTWTLPAYGGAENKYPGFKTFKSACDAILLGNRATLNFCPAGTIFHSAYIKEYNG